MAKNPTLAERLAVLETLLESYSKATSLALQNNADTAQRALKTLENAFEEGGAIADIRSDVKAIRKDLDEHKEDYAALKNRGLGVIATLSVFMAGAGYVASLFADKIAAVISR